MEFESWWNEEGPSKLDHPPGPGTTVRRLNAQTGHGTKHTMTIFYFTAEQLFQVHIGARPHQNPCRAKLSVSAVTGYPFIMPACVLTSLACWRY